MIGLVDSTGTSVVEYNYDAWGKNLFTTGTLATTLGQVNPFRYRGYYFDTESGFYYLQSRYYDPKTGRFINADDTSILQMTQGELLGGNLYAYCGNCPVNMVDDNGHLPKWITDFTRGFIDGFGNAAKGLLNAFLQPLQTLKSILSLKNFISGWFSGLTVGWRILYSIVRGNFYKAGVLYGGHIFRGFVVLVTWAVGQAFVKIAGVIRQTVAVKDLINSVNKFKLSNTITKHIPVRPYMNSTQIIQNIMKAAKPVKDASLKNGYKWSVQGTWWQRGWANVKTGTWELVVDANTKTIVHMLFKPN